MWWENSADRVGNNSLIQNVVEVLGSDDGSGLENFPNNYSTQTIPTTTFELGCRTPIPTQYLSPVWFHDVVPLHQRLVSNLLSTFSHRQHARVRVVSKVDFF